MVTQKEQKERVKTRKEKMGGYFLNLSQVTFAAVVLGGIPGLFSDTDAHAWIKILLGILCTIAFAWIGNIILK
jgi:hypothetical protein